MKDKVKASAAPMSATAADSNGKPVPMKPEQDSHPAAEDTATKTDRPGFDLGGSSGDTHAGSGLGLGVDAFDTAGDRRLSGRRPDNKLTIPRWSGPEPDVPPTSDEKTAAPEARPGPQTKQET